MSFSPEPSLRTGLGRSGRSAEPLQSLHSPATSRPPGPSHSTAVSCPPGLLRKKTARPLLSRLSVADRQAGRVIFSASVTFQMAMI